MAEGISWTRACDFTKPARTIIRADQTTKGEPPMEAAANTLKGKPPTWYWIVSGLALVWMLMGVMAWFTDLMTDEAALAQMSEAQRQVYLSRPQWLFIVYAVAIFAGLAGAIGLLMRKAWATTAFAISLIAVAVQFGYTFLVMDAVRLLGAGVALPFPIVIFAIGVFLLWFSSNAKRAGRLA
jgi:hypothetical protein